MNFESIFWYQNFIDDYKNDIKLKHLLFMFLGFYLEPDF